MKKVVDDEDTRGEEKLVIATKRRHVPLHQPLDAKEIFEGDFEGGSHFRFFFAILPSTTSRVKLARKPPAHAGSIASLSRAA